MRVQREVGTRKNSKVQQNLVKSTNINTMVKQLVRTDGQSSGHPGGKTELRPIFKDNYDNPTFAEQMDIVAAGTSAFEELPSKIRSHFKNDLSAFSEFMSNPDNLEKARELGIIEPAPEPPPEKEEAETPPEPPEEEKST